MLKGEVSLIIDLGNSSTKSAILYKGSKDDKQKLYMFERTNEWGVVLATDNINQYMSEYDDKTSAIIKVGEQMYCCGEIQRVNYPAALRPTAKIKKYLYVGTPVTIRFAFLNALRIIEQIEGVSYQELDLLWNVVTLLPPGDIDAGRDTMIQIIKDTAYIDCIFPEVMYDININKDNIKVLPEGLCAYMATVFDLGKKVRQDYKYLSKETVLVADIGAGTTDIILVKGNKLVQDSKYTADIGGNNVAVNLVSELRKQGITVKRSTVEDAIEQGFLKNGTDKIDIKEMLDTVKKKLSSELNQNIIDYFETIKIDTSEIGYIIICGGGSIDDKCGVQSLGVYVANSFRSVVPNTELVEPPYHTTLKVDDKFDINRVDERISPRDLNLIGACIMSELLK